MNYFSAEFKYPAARRGFSAPGIHMSFAVDEAEESRRLSAAMKEVDATLQLLRLDNTHEYCWPDGAFYLYIRSEAPAFDVWWAISLLVPAHITVAIYEVDEDYEHINGEKLKDLWERRDQLDREGKLK